MTNYFIFDIINVYIKGNKVASEIQQAQLDKLNKAKEKKTMAKIESVLNNPKHLIFITTQSGKPKAKAIAEISKLDCRTVAKYLKRKESEGWGGQKDILRKAKDNFNEDKHTPAKKTTDIDKVKTVLGAPKHLHTIETRDGKPKAIEIASILNISAKRVATALKKIKCKGWGGDKDCLQSSRTKVKWQEQRKKDRK